MKEQVDQKGARLTQLGDIVAMKFKCAEDAKLHGQCDLLRQENQCGACRAVPHRLSSTPMVRFRHVVLVAPGLDARHDLNFLQRLGRSLTTHITNRASTTAFGNTHARKRVAKDGRSLSPATVD